MNYRFVQISTWKLTNERERKSIVRRFFSEALFYSTPWTGQWALDLMDIYLNMQIKSAAL